MLSAEDLAAVRIAIQMCNNSDLKTELLCAPGSGYDKYKTYSKYNLKEQWNEIVERKTENILNKLGVLKQLQGKVIGLVMSIGMRMLKWAEYHERTFGLTREYSINFLNSFCFTSQGILDNKKAAEQLIKDDSLSIKQKYKLACLYCLTDHISDLYGQMSMEEFFDDQGLQRVNQPKMVKFWSFYLMYELQGEKSVDEYRLETAVQSGSKAAVEYCLEKTGLRRNDSIIAAAIETVRNRMRRETNAITAIYDSSNIHWVVSRDQTFDCRDGSWIPSDYFVDILYLLLSKMREDQELEFLKQDIEGDNYEITNIENPRHSRVLEYFLNWPYQNYFMKTAKLMWEFLPERTYADLLMDIYRKINPPKGDLKYGEEKSYDYRKLFREFWCESPNHYKRYMFSDKETSDKNGDKETVNEGKQLLINLFTLTNFTNQDWKNVELILGSATTEEKERIISYKKGENICIELMKKEQWQMLYKFVSNCFPFQEQSDEFKRGLCFTETAQRVCIGFIERDNWDAAESFVKFSSFPEEAIMRVKANMIYHEDGRRVCRNKIACGRKEACDKFIRWCFPFEEKAFKKDLFSTAEICELVIQSVVGDQVEFVDELFNWGLLTEEEIRAIKKHIADTLGCPLCERVISESTIRIVYEENSYFGPAAGYKETKWECVEKLLTWCFSFEDEISNFKKDRLLELSGKKIHLNLIKYNQWEEAETYFAWIGLSPEEIKELKRETLFNEDACKYLRSLMYITEDEEDDSDDESQQEVASVDLLLRWCLTDEETVLEFRDHFKQRYDRGNVTEEDRAALKEFDSAIEECLRDLDEEQRDEKKVDLSRT